MPPSILRSAHGNGGDAILRAERPPLDELAAPNAELARQGHEELTRRGRPFQKNNQAAKGRRPALALLGVPIDTSDARWRRAMRKARRYMQRRVRDLAAQCGGTLGTGPSAMLASAARALAASTVLYELAGETLDPKMFRDAAALADSARQQELTAVGLAEREVAARPKNNAPPAWMVPVNQEPKR